jgi:hypothetical protein
LSALSGFACGQAKNEMMAEGERKSKFIDLGCQMFFFSFSSAQIAAREKRKMLFRASIIGPEISSDAANSIHANDFLIYKRRKNFACSS